MAEIRGVVRADGKPVSGAAVLFVTRAMDALLSAATTDANGAFSGRISGGDHSEAIALARISGSVVGLQQRPVDLGRSEPVTFDFDLARDFVRLDGDIESSAGRPDVLDVWLNPVTLEGIPQQLQRFFRQQGPGVFGAYFSKVAVKGDSFSFRVKRGTYQLGGDRINYDRAVIGEPKEKDYVVHAATLVPENTPLQGDETLGFTIHADRDRKVVLWLRVVEQAELRR
jgi:hypothetical protein